MNKSTTISKKVIKKLNNIQNGGGPLENHFSTDGSISNGVTQIANSIENIFYSITNAIDATVRIIELPSAFSSIVNKPNEPLPSNVPIPRPTPQ